MVNKNLHYQSLKKISAEKKLIILLDLIYSARELKRAALRAKYKNESDQEIDARLKEILRHATT
jgi:hypothetical protein